MTSYVYLTSGSLWTVPSDFPATGGTWTMEATGESGKAAAGASATVPGGGAGQGGGYGKADNTTVSPNFGTPGTTQLAIQIGTGGTATATFIKDASNTTIVQGDYGASASGGTGGARSQTNVGATLTKAGGVGGNGTGSLAGGGGGGAGGPNGVGAAGSVGNQGNGTGGGGGGAASGGSAGSAGAICAARFASTAATLTHGVFCIFCRHNL